MRRPPLQKVILTSSPNFPPPKNCLGCLTKNQGCILYFQGNKMYKQPPFTGKIWYLEYISSNLAFSVHADFKADGHSNLLFKISLKSYQFTHISKTTHLPAAAAAAAATKSLQLCPTLCSSIDCSPPGSPVLGILQARTLEWVAISFSSA